MLKLIKQDLKYTSHTVIADIWVRAKCGDELNTKEISILKAVFNLDNFMSTSFGCIVSIDGYEITYLRGYYFGVKPIASLIHLT